MEHDSPIWQELLNIAKGNEDAPFFLLGWLRSSLTDESVRRAIKGYREFEAEQADRLAERQARLQARMMWKPDGQ